MPGATPPSELLSEPATQRVVGARTRCARLKRRACAACVPAGGRYVRVASRVRVRVCECVRQERRLAWEPFIPRAKERVSLAGL